MSQVDPASLANLHDIVGAPPAPWWPPAPGWFVLAAVLVAIVVYSVLCWQSRRRANAYRRAALAELDLLTRNLNNPEQRVPSLRALPELVKRTALAAWPRSAVAGLSGDLWLEWLDDSWPRTGFAQGAGQKLLQLSYADSSQLFDLPPEEVDDLVVLIRQWIAQHRRPEASAEEGANV